MKRILLILMLLLSSPVYAALDAGIVWEVRTTGAQTNGGGYKTGASGSDFSQQAAAQYALASVGAAGAQAVMTHASSAAVMVGNVCYVVSGTNATVGWYEIVSVNVGVDLTVDRNWCTGACADGVVNVGGAFLAGGSLDDDFFSGFTAGNQCWIKAGTYTVQTEDITGGAGTSIAPQKYYGYNATRGDNPTGDNRPLFDLGVRDWTPGAHHHLHYLRFTGTGGDVVRINEGNIFFACKSTNTELVFGGRQAFDFVISNSALIACEASSARGTAINLVADNSLYGCYIHDCDDSAVIVPSDVAITNCIFETCLVGLEMGFNDGIYVSGCTFVNNGVAINASSGNLNTFINNIFADNAIGAKWTTAEPVNLWAHNLWSDNDADTSLVTKGDTDITGSALLGYTVVEGTDGVTDGAGTAFTAASNPFAGVTTDDFLNIVEVGTGATLGVYGIAAVVGAGEITLGRSAGASKTGIDYRLIIGSDFTLGTGSPAIDAAVDAGTYTDATAGVTDIGAIESAGGGGTTINVKSANKKGGKQ